MEITNKLTDLEKKDQWNFGMDCSALMTNGHISFHDYRNNQNQNIDHRSQWDYFIRKGFGYALDKYRVDRFRWNDGACLIRSV